MLSHEKFLVPVATHGHSTSYIIKYEDRVSRKTSDISKYKERTTKITKLK
jgi:hypothetical protein